MIIDEWAGGEDDRGELRSICFSGVNTILDLMESWREVSGFLLLDNGLIFNDFYSPSVS